MADAVVLGLGVLLVIAFAVIAWPLGGFEPASTLHAPAMAVLLMGLGVMLSHLPLVWVYRLRAFRERDAGYTTTYGDTATISLGRGPEIVLFRTTELWQLDGRTGAVVRRPGGTTPDAWKREDEEARDFEEFASRLGEQPQ